MSGYIKLHRSVIDNPLWDKDPYSAGQAWIDLLLAANFKPASIYIRKQRIDLDRGQLAWSTVTMAKRWKWSRGRVNRFLSELKKEGMIEQQTGQLTTITTICNYEKFQGRDTADGTTGDTASGTASDTADGTASGTQYKKGKNGKKEKNGEGQSKSAPARYAGLDLSKLPEGVPEQSAKDFIDHRKTIKKQMSQRALALCMNAAARADQFGLSAEQVIDETIARGWQKPEPEWVRNALVREQKNVTRFPGRDEYGLPKSKSEEDMERHKDEIDEFVRDAMAQGGHLK